MFWYLVRRLLLVIPTLIGVAVAVFFLIRVMPGDVVVVKLRADGAAISEETIQAERKRLGLDKPLYVQFVDYMVGLTRLDLGKSLWTGEPVTKEIAIRMPVSFQIAHHGRHHRRAHRHSARHHLGALPRHLGRPHRARGGGLGPRHPLVLARHADHPGAAVAVQLAAQDRLRAVLAGPDRQPGRDHLARRLGRLSLCRRRHPHDALLAARGDARGLHPHRPRQGRVDAPHHAPPRAAQRAAARWSPSSASSSPS